MSLSGVIKSFSPATGFGFILCDQVKNHYGCDVFLPQRQLGTCQVGDQVAFDIEINRTGKPQALNLRRLGGVDASVSQFYANAAGGAGKSAGKAQGNSQPSHDAGSVMRLPGVVKSFVAKSGYGFLSCAEVMETYGSDVFVTAQDMGSFKVGDEVVFEFFENQQGKAQGKNLEPAARWGVAFADPQGAKVPQAVQNAQLDLALVAVETSGLVGVIKSFVPKTGYGFIECPEVKEAYGSDVFLPAAEKGNCSVGDTVSFDVGLNNSQKPQACNVQLLSAASSQLTSQPMRTGVGKGRGAAADARQPQAGCEKGAHTRASDQGQERMWKGQKRRPEPQSSPDLGRFTGIIKSFAPSNGWGFISCPEAQAEYGCDIFLMGSEIGTHVVGDTVTFTIFLNLKGKPQAKELAAANGSVSAGAGCAGAGGCNSVGWGKNGGGMGKDWACGAFKGCGGKGGACGKGKPGSKGDAASYACGKGKMGFDGDAFGKGGLSQFAAQYMGFKGDAWWGKYGGKGPGKNAWGKDAWGKDAWGKDGPLVKKQKIEYTFEEGERQLGVVKSFTPKSGYGFIECPVVKERYGFDLYFKGVQLGGADEGSTVSFNVKVTPDGKPQADDIKPA